MSKSKPAPNGVNKSRALILSAMRTGVSDPKRIADLTGLSVDRVSAELTNMQVQHKVRNNAGRWYLVGPCALETHWKGMREETRT